MPELSFARMRRRAHPSMTFVGNTAGASAVEFALILPIMLTLLIGMSEMAHAIDNWRKVTLLGRTVADLTSQGDSSDPIASTTMTDIMGAASAVLRPFGTANVKIVVSALGVDTTASVTSPRVCSSIATSNAKARVTGVASDLTIPVGFNTNGNRYVIAEVTMPYSPMVGASLVKFATGSGTITVSSVFPWPVRNGAVHNSKTSTPEVTMPGGTPCP